jgi:hypothetical protein
MKYLDRLNQTAEETAKTNNVLVAEEANLATQTAILNCKRELGNAKLRLDAVTSVSPFCPETAYSMQNRIEILERKLTVLTAIHKDLF